MVAESVLLTVLVVVAIAVCVAAIFALAVGVSTLRSARHLLDDLDSKLVPLIEKADITIDAVNAELLRVDGIVTRFEEVSEGVSSATSAVREAASLPADAVSALSSRVRTFIRGRRR